MIFFYIYATFSIYYLKKASKDKFKCPIIYGEIFQKFAIIRFNAISGNGFRAC